MTSIDFQERVVTIIARRLTVIAFVPLMAGIANDAVATAERSPGELYGLVCAHCHETRIGPDLKGRTLPVATVKHFVRYGNRAMPAWRPSEISDQELQRLADWVHAMPAGMEAHHAAP